MSFNYNKIIDHAVLHIGPEQPAVFNTILEDVMYEFLRDSQVHTIDVTLPSVIDQLVYDFQAEANNFQFYQIFSVKFNGGPAISTLDWTFTRHNTITFVNAFDTAGDDVTVNAVLTSRNRGIIAQLPADIFDMYNDYIAKGVLSKMTRLPNKPYTSIERSNDYHREYIIGVRDALYHVNRRKNFRGIDGKHSTTKP